MPRRVFAAVDIGASGGRVMAGVVESGTVSLQPVHRFANGVVEADGHLRWPVHALFDEVVTGLSELASEFPEVESIGIDTWGVDYALLDDDGQLVDQPIAYRDDRTRAAIDVVHGIVEAADLYEINGQQFLPFNTVYQLVADQRSGRLDGAAHVVLLPDLLACWLTGELRTEATNASTTGLLDARSGQWSNELLARLGLPSGLVLPLQQPGEVRGRVQEQLRARLGLPASTVVTTVGSHDTASAVVAVPAVDRHFAYVSSGTWSLVGLELDEPIITAASRAANFTNEGGVDRRTRFLRNTCGLWLLQESMRAWSEAGHPQDLTSLLAAAAELPAGGPLIDVDDPAFIPPGQMPARIAAAAEAGGAIPPTTPPAVVRCIIDSLAASYATTIRRAAELADTRVDVVHIVGGGSQNRLLCQLTADRSGRAVAAGPVEATAFGNVLIQARACGAVPASLDAIRVELARVVDVTRYEPIMPRAEV